jgi:hypothetical protein
MDLMPKSMDSLDVIQIVILAEDIFETEIPDNDAERWDSPPSIVDWLEIHLANQRPSERAAALLRKLAKANNDPEIAQGLEGTWRREQIAAIIREFFKLAR